MTPDPPEPPVSYDLTYEYTTSFTSDDKSGTIYHNIKFGDDSAYLLTGDAQYTCLMLLDGVWSFGYFYMGSFAAYLQFAVANDVTLNQNVAVKTLNVSTGVISNAGELKFTQEVPNGYLALVKSGTFTIGQR